MLKKFEDLVSKKARERTKKLSSELKNGLITGAADDDPSGIATYSQSGAQFGHGLLWTLIFTTPLMVAIQLVGAKIGWVTGRGLAHAMCNILPKKLALFLIGLMVVANTLNIAADIAAMGEALQLIVGGREHGHALVFGVLCAVLPVWLNYESMVRVLKWLTLSLFAYVAVLLMLNVDWQQTFQLALSPHISANKNYWMMVVAVLGTTISPYLFFWQASQEAELRQVLKKREDFKQSVVDVSDKPMTTDDVTIKQTVDAYHQFMKTHVARIKLDTNVGMLFSNLIAFSIMLATALTLHQHGIIDITSSKQAAEALRPIAGEFTFYLFSLGVIGTGMLAVPVLAGSAAYALAEVFSWKSGLNLKINEAKGFYGVLICATLVGTLLDFSALDPIKALVWSAVVNGVVAVPIMAVMMYLARHRQLLGDYIIGRSHALLGWLATAVMFLAVGAMLFDMVF
jgi:Mn2+/Fe2+ NRAMP family transporter